MKSKYNRLPKHIRRKQAKANRPKSLFSRPYSEMTLEELEQTMFGKTTSHYRRLKAEQANKRKGD